MRSGGMYASSLCRDFVGYRIILCILMIYLYYKSIIFMCEIVITTRQNSPCIAVAEFIFHHVHQMCSVISQVADSLDHHFLYIQFLYIERCEIVANTLRVSVLLLYVVAVISIIIQSVICVTQLYIFHALYIGERAIAHTHCLLSNR